MMQKMERKVLSSSFFFSPLLNDAKLKKVVENKKLVHAGIRAQVSSATTKGPNH